MVYRALKLNILKRYKSVLRMETDNYLPSNLKRCFFIGLGIGTGLAVSFYAAKKLNQRTSRPELVTALNQVTDEIKELRVAMVHHFERTASAFSNEQILTNTARRVRIQDELVRQSEAVPEQDESSSEDDFFDLFDEDVDIEQNHERYVPLFHGSSKGLMVRDKIAYFVKLINPSVNVNPYNPLPWEYVAIWYHLQIS